MFSLRYAVLLAVIIVCTAALPATGVGIHDYQLQRTFTLPAATIGNVLLDPLPDGRLLVLNNTTVSVETAPQSGSFTSLGNIASFTPGFGPTFLIVSPDGTRAAAGSNGAGSVVVFSTANPASATSFAMQDFGAAWIDNRYIAVSNFSTTTGVQILDTQTAAITQAIANIGGASTDISFDAAGNLYTGNGFDLGPTGSSTGWVKAFSASDWQNALATSTPLNFETTGVPVVDLLSGFPMGFDPSGNMLVGGSDFFGDSDDVGYAAIVEASAIADALANPQPAPPITTASSTSILRKFLSPPDTVSGSQPPFWNYNQATGELYLGYTFGDGTIYVYAVPEPSGLLLASVAALLISGRRNAQRRATRI